MYDLYGQLFFQFYKTSVSTLFSCIIINLYKIKNANKH